MPLKIRAAHAVAAFACSGAAHAQPSARALDEVVVFGRGEAKVGVAHTASEGTVAGSDLLVRPLLRVAELLEAVPGLVAAQHSGSGKANQYFLRGFNLDHGSDFTAYVDDVQMNLRTHGHGQGYLDLNGLIPEVVEREDYRKGPYRADGGDFAMAGAAYMTTIAGYDAPWVAAEGGSYGWRRVAAGGTAHALGPGDLTLVGQAKTYDGPWALPEDLRHYALFSKYVAPVRTADLELILHAYRGRWRPTEQIPDRIVGSSICRDVFCAPDATATGETTRVVAAARLLGDGWRAALNGQAYDWTMYSNPTFADADGRSAQIRQFDRRWVLAGRIERQLPLSDTVELSGGGEFRLDHIGEVGVHRTDARAFVASLGAYQVEELSGAAYGEAVWRPLPGLRLIGGLRADHYRVDVRARDPEAALLGEGRDTDTLLSPKVNMAYAPVGWLEVYGAWGRGFHSNDARGAVSATPVPLLVPGRGAEAGARLQTRRLTATATYWRLDLDSELKFVGDSNAVEPTGASRRRGYELVAFWRPLAWLALDASYTASHARYRTGDFIPNAFENAAQLGLAAVRPRWEASLRVRHLGPYPLVEDNSVRDRGSTVVNARGAWKTDRLELYAEVLNLLDRRDKDMAYWYEAFVPGVDAEPTEGRLGRVLEPRTLRIGAKRRF
ncbi:TonB-dependent receptor [Phenylobacterium sp.]|jgi:outer membrane receptor protein involved in Fe transport|uniref:TonB-dependent receptor n=1 Tax=Phenylobacterium sp. TaxID=1871053 RepID=UPI002F931BF8